MTLSPRKGHIRDRPCSPRRNVPGDTPPLEHTPPATPHPPQGASTHLAQPERACGRSRRRRRRGPAGRAGPARPAGRRTPAPAPAAPAPRQALRGGGVTPLPRPGGHGETEARGGSEGLELVPGVVSRCAVPRPSSGAGTSGRWLVAGPAVRLGQAMAVVSASGDRKGQVPAPGRPTDLLSWPPQRLGATPLAPRPVPCHVPAAGTHR